MLGALVELTFTLLHTEQRRQFVCSFLSYQISTLNLLSSIKIKRGDLESLLILRHKFFTWVLHVLIMDTGGERKEKEGNAEVCSQKQAEDFCTSSVRTLFRADTCMACFHFFQKSSTDCAWTSVSYIPSLTGGFNVLFQHICVISETGKQKYKAWKHGWSALTTKLWNVLFTKSYLSLASTLVHQLKL